LAELTSKHSVENILPEFFTALDRSIVRIGFPEENEWLYDFDPARLESSSYWNTLKQRYSVFTFWQRYPDTKPRYNFQMEWDYIEVLKIRTFLDWWRSIDRKTRNMVRKAEKSAVVIREVVPDEEFLKGVAEIYNETPLRQGVPFKHFGKNLEEVKARFEKLWIPQSTFIGAYLAEELIGLTQLLHSDKYTLVLQILSKMKYLDRAPNNAMIAKAVEICANKKVRYLIYQGHFMRGGSLTHFKRSNGFVERRVPRYYVPLTLEGKIVLSLHLHHGIRYDIIPQPIRKMYYELVWRRKIPQYEHYETLSKVH
jgi:hypothetical protein